jgi:hypothetical protein
MEKKVICGNFFGYQDSKFLFYKWKSGVNNNIYECVTHIYPTQKSFIESKGGTWWSEEMIDELISLDELGCLGRDKTEKINIKFGCKLTGKQTDKGYKGSVTKKLEHVKENKINWSQYTNNERLTSDTIKLYDENKCINRYW